MGKISYVTKVVDFYENNGFNATVVLEKKKTSFLMDMAATT